MKPLGADGVKIHPQDILNAAWRDDLGEEGLAMYARNEAVRLLKNTNYWERIGERNVYVEEVK